MDTASPIITAVLGPTNTGKTHYAIERMLSYKSGIIGFPLRLLARENYDRVVEQKGKQAVALITGEEKILPEKARYFLCTVESMPTDKSTEFLAVDEIQLISDQERGHVFTNRCVRGMNRAACHEETIRDVQRQNAALQDEQVKEAALGHHLQLHRTCAIQKCMDVSLFFAGHISKC